MVREISNPLIIKKEAKPAQLCLAHMIYLSLRDFSTNILRLWKHYHGEGVLDSYGPPN